jgi:hypothetical protein
VSGTSEIRHKQTSIHLSRYCSDPEEPVRETLLTRCTNSSMRCCHFRIIRLK